MMITGCQERMYVPIAVHDTSFLQMIGSKHHKSILGGATAQRKWCNRIMNLVRAKVGFMVMFMVRIRVRVGLVLVNPNCFPNAPHY